MADAANASSSSRRDFLRLAAGGVTLLAAGMGCNSGSGAAKSKAATAPTTAGGKGRRTLRIAQWRHGVPTYDIWLDNDFAKRWGEEHDVEVVLDHIPVLELSARADTEVAAQRGHDLFAFLSPPAATGSTCGKASSPVSVPTPGTTSCGPG